jgi:putative copper resistance protein D
MMDEPATVTGLLIFARAIYLGSGMVLVNAAVFRWLILSRAVVPTGGATQPWRERFRRRLRTTFLVSAALLAVATVLWFWAVAAEMSGTSLLDALDRTTWTTVLFQTHFGSVCEARIALFVLLAGPAWHFCRADSSLKYAAFPIDVATSLVSAALLASVAWTGHAGAMGGGAFPWTLIADSIHLLAGAIWPAGLLFFAWILSSTRARENPAPLPAATAIAQRFAVVSLAAVVVLTATGLVDTFFMVRSFGAMISTPYGRVLCLKLALFAVMLAFAGWNRFRLLPLLQAANEGTTRDRADFVLGQLRRFVRIELGLAAGIVIVVAFLGTMAPPHP